jgi:hypothetical protein
VFLEAPLANVARAVKKAWQPNLRDDLLYLPEKTFDARP